MRDDVLRGTTRGIQICAPAHHRSLQRLTQRHRGPPRERLPRPGRIPRPRHRHSAAPLRGRKGSGQLCRALARRAEPASNSRQGARARREDARMAARPTVRVEPAHAHAGRAPRRATPRTANDAPALPKPSEPQQQSAPRAWLRAAEQTPSAQPEGERANGQGGRHRGHAPAHTIRGALRSCGERDVCRCRRIARRHHPSRGTGFTPGDEGPPGRGPAGSPPSAFKASWKGRSEFKVSGRPRGFYTPPAGEASVCAVTR